MGLVRVAAGNEDTADLVAVVLAAADAVAESSPGVLPGGTRHPTTESH
jgi:hypothetical protein